MAKNALKSKKHLEIEKTKQNVFLIVVVASIVLSASIVLGKFILDWSSFNTRVWSAQSEAISTLETNIENAETTINEYRAFEATSEVGPELLLDALPAEYDYSAWNSSLQFIVGLNSLDLESLGGTDLSLEAQTATVNPTPQEFEFGLEVSGPYDNIKSFIADLNRSVRPIVLERLTISGNVRNTSLTTSGKTFYQPSQSLDFETEEIR